jgi:hypothetical protein
LLLPRSTWDRAGDLLGVNELQEVDVGQWCRS